jgi:hypothetical protein
MNKKTAKKLQWWMNVVTTDLSARGRLKLHRQISSWLEKSEPCDDRASANAFLAALTKLDAEPLYPSVMSKRTNGVLQAAIDWEQNPSPIEGQRLSKAVRKYMLERR